KTFRQRVQWIQDLMWDKKQIVDMNAFYGSDGIWQVRGESCMNFGRECDHMDTCQLATAQLTKPLLESQLVENKEYQFNFTLEELLS
ncbi:hypothetical protein ACKI1Z_41855, partial [Streptomyces galilaeus]|uniref:hypothetical protein n=1 Tax=Streptomyces galilaeus TaxID=33899 RepID=UPI0038F6F2C4